MPCRIGKKRAGPDNDEVFIFNVVLVDVVVMIIYHLDVVGMASTVKNVRDSDSDSNVFVAVVSSSTGVLSPDDL